MRQGKRLIALALVVISGLVAASIVAAKLPTVIHDPSGDVSGKPPGSVSKQDVDIVKASAGHSGGKVELTITVNGSIKTALNRVEDSPGFFLRKHGAMRDGFDVFGTVPPGYQAQSYASGKETDVKVTTPDKHEAKFTFNPNPIGLPDNFDWQAVTGICQPLDQAPNHGVANGKATKRC